MVERWPGGRQYNKGEEPALDDHGDTSHLETCELSQNKNEYAAEESRIVFTCFLKLSFYLYTFGIFHVNPRNN